MGPPNPRIVIEGSDLLDKAAAGEDVDLEMADLVAKQSVEGSYRMESSGQPTEKFEEGDLMIFTMGGGGGYGDVLERDPDDIQKDLDDRMIDPHIAEGVYGAVIDAATGRIDLAATEKKRASMRRERLRKARPFDRFVADWRRRKPKEHVIAYYGEWPEPRAPGYDKEFWGFYG